MFVFFFCSYRICAVVRLVLLLFIRAISTYATQRITIHSISLHYEFDAMLPSSSSSSSTSASAHGYFVRKSFHISWIAGRWMELFESVSSPLMNLESSFIQRKLTFGYMELHEIGVVADRIKWVPWVVSPSFSTRSNELHLCNNLLQPIMSMKRNYHSTTATANWTTGTDSNLWKNNKLRKKTSTHREMMCW